MSVDRAVAPSRIKAVAKDVASLVDGGATARLLAWYDANARVLPWRAPPGTPAPDPYRVWLSEIMLQQTTVAAVKPYFLRFTQRWPNVEALAAADNAELMAAWAGLGYYARARNLLACARAVVSLHGGRFPTDEATLATLPGIGGYTAAAIAAIAFGRDAAAVDANVERVVARLFAVETPLPAARPQLRTLAGAMLPSGRAGDFAQAIMDLGATICTSRSPACILCPLAGDCRARALGIADRLPVKAAKAPKPRRRGSAFWLEHEGRVLLLRRPAKGLLGGMRALPSGPWTTADPALAGAPVPADWRQVGSVAHVFTHFALDLAVFAAASYGPPTTIAEGEWWPVDEIEAAGLPTLFAKAATLARATTGNERNNPL